MTDSIEKALHEAGIDAEVHELPDGVCEIACALEGDGHAQAARLAEALAGVAAMQWPFYAVPPRFVAFARPVTP